MGDFQNGEFHSAGKIEIGDKPDKTIQGYWNIGVYEGEDLLEEVSPVKLMEEVKEDINAEDRRESIKLTKKEAEELRSEVSLEP